MSDKEIITEIAEKIMGWHIVYCMGAYHYLPKKHSQPHYNDPFITHDHGTATDWNPIDNPNHWMMVVKKVSERIFTGYNIHYSLGWWRVSFYVSTDKIYEKSSDKSIGLAVCLAALQAIEGESKDDH